MLTPAHSCRYTGAATVASTDPVIIVDRQKENTFGHSFKPSSDLGKCCDIHNPCGGEGLRR